MFPLMKASGTKYCIAPFFYECTVDPGYNDTGSYDSPSKPLRIHVQYSPVITTPVYTTQRLNHFVYMYSRVRL